MKNLVFATGNSHKLQEVQGLFKEGFALSCLKDVNITEEIHAYIRSLIAEKYGNEVAENTTILYGGSCKGSNAKELFSKPNVDGGLIGGASLKAADFKEIIDAF